MSWRGAGVAWQQGGHLPTSVDIISPVSSGYSWTPSWAGPGVPTHGGGDLLKAQPPSSSASVAASSTASGTSALCFVTESLPQESLC